jgi:hypothetical protein
MHAQHRVQWGVLFGRQQIYGAPIHSFHGNTTATGNAGEGVISDDNRQPRFLGNQSIHVAQQGPTTGEHNTTFGDIGSELRGRLFQCGFHGLYNRCQRILQMIWRQQKLFLA